MGSRLLRLGTLMNPVVADLDTRRDSCHVVGMATAEPFATRTLVAPLSARWWVDKLDR
jgi:hypothetical protein